MPFRKPDFSISSKKLEEIFEAKVRLICEYDRQSPLFVRFAANLIEENNVEDALAIINQRLNEFPYNPIALILRGKAETLLGLYDDAINDFKLSGDLINSAQTSEYYLKELESIRKQRSLFEAGSRKSFLMDNDFTSPISNQFSFSHSSGEDDIIEIEERLEQLASEISGAKINISESTNLDDNVSLADLSEKNIIISETLAKIYAAQGETEEAIKVYEKLINKSPSQKDYFTSKILELRSELGNQ